MRIRDLDGDHITGKIAYIDWPGWAGRASCCPSIRFEAGFRGTNPSSRKGVFAFAPEAFKTCGLPPAPRRHEKEDQQGAGDADGPVHFFGCPEAVHHAGQSEQEIQGADKRATVNDQP